MCRPVQCDVNAVNARTRFGGTRSTMGLQFDAWPADTTAQLVEAARSLSTGANLSGSDRLNLIEMVTTLGLDLPTDEHQAFIDHVLKAADISVSQPVPALKPAISKPTKPTPAASRSKAPGSGSRSSAQTGAHPVSGAAFRSNVTLDEGASQQPCPKGFASGVEFAAERDD